MLVYCDIFTILYLKKQYNVSEDFAAFERKCKFSFLFAFKATAKGFSTQMDKGV